MLRLKRVVAQHHGEFDQQLLLHQLQTVVRVLGHLRQRVDQVLRDARDEQLTITTSRRSHVVAQLRDLVGETLLQRARHVREAVQRLSHRARLSTPQHHAPCSLLRVEVLLHDGADAVQTVVRVLRQHQRQLADCLQRLATVHVAMTARHQVVESRVERRGRTYTSMRYSSVRKESA